MPPKLHDELGVQNPDDLQKWTIAEAGTHGIGMYVLDENGERIAYVHHRNLAQRIARIPQVEYALMRTQVLLLGMEHTMEDIGLEMAAIPRIEVGSL